MAPCASHLRQIAHALTNYESCYGSYPPAYVAAEDGTRLHSWRVLILPFLEYQSLYDRYNFAELWDGPRNRKLLSEMPSVYACPARSDDGRRPTDCTSYVAVVGDRTMWPGESVTSASDVRDGLSNTVQVIEYDTQSVPWLQPEDLPLETLPQAVVPCDSTVGGGHRVRTFFTQYSTGRHVAFADGRTAYIGHGTEEAVWSGLLTVNDGRGWTNDIAQDGSVSGRRVNIGNGIRLALFVLLVLLPLASRHHVCSGTQCAEYPGKQGGEA